MQNILNQFNNNKELRVVNNQVGSPTYSYDLALFILTILPKLNSNQAEIYNFSNEGFCSRYEFAKEIFKIMEESIKIFPVNSSVSNAKRPKFSALDLTKIKNEFIYAICDWEVKFGNLFKQIDLI